MSPGYLEKTWMQESGLPGEDLDAGVRITWRRCGCMSLGYMEKTWMQESGLPREDEDAGVRVT
jgi:hypothetical protein